MQPPDALDKQEALGQSLARRGAVLDPGSQRANEQRKQVSSVIANLGTALIIAGFGRWWSQGVDPYVLLWILSGIGITWCGVKVLGLLDVEPGDE